MPSIAQGTFLKKDDPKVQALMQQAELLISLAMKMLGSPLGKVSYLSMRHRIPKYSSLAAAKAAVISVGEEIATMGLPPGICPLVFVFTGSGNVSRGAQEIFKLLPYTFVDPRKLSELHETSVATYFNHVMSAIGGNTAGPGDGVVNVYINHEKKFAFVEMRSMEEASNAMALDGIIFEAYPLWSLAVPPELTAAFKQHFLTYGGLDICINSSGIANPVPFHKDLTDGSSSWRHTVNVDLVAVIHSTRLAEHLSNANGTGIHKSI